MIVSDSFWEEEADAPLLRRNAGFLSPKNARDMVKKAENWEQLVEAKCGFVDTARHYECDDEELLRIFKMDAERTFDSTKRQEKMSRLLRRICAEIDDYHQGLGFVVAYLLLLVEEEDSIIKIVLGLHRHYVSGYYMSAPRAYVRDAKVFYMILDAYFPELHKHIKDMVPPEAFCSKWFVGFNVHVLPFPALFNFFENVLTLGQPFLFQFALALCQRCKADLMNTKDVGRVLEILRLDAKLYPDCTKTNDGGEEGSFFTELINDAVAFELDKVDIEALRKDADEVMRIADELKAKRDAERAEESDDEIVFSDEE